MENFTNGTNSIEDNINSFAEAHFNPDEAMKVVVQNMQIHDEE